MSAGPIDVRTFTGADEAAASAVDVIESATERSIVALDADGLVVLWNEGARRLYRHERSEILGRSWALLYSEEDLRDGLPQQIMRVALATGKWEGLVKPAHDDGSALTARVVVTPRRGSPNRPGGFVLIASDITDEQGLAQDLGAAQSFARSLLESAPDAMVIINDVGEILLTNAETERQFGYARDELIGNPIEMLIPERYRDRHPGHRRRFFADPRSRSMGAGLDLWGLRKDGSEFPVEISLSPLLTEGGVLGTAAIRDVTERRRSESKFGGLLESAPDAMVIVNQSGEVQLANAETERLFGYTRSELIGRPVEMLIPVRYHALHPTRRDAFFGEPRTRSMGAGLELLGRRKDGVEFPVEISLSPLETEDGLLATAAIRDVTESRRIEQQLREANAQLEGANRAKDRFLSSMSHELRTPLNAILGFTGTILMELPGELNDEQERQLRVVQANGRHLLSLINDLLDLARIESGKLALNIEPIECGELLSEVATSLRPLAESKSLELVAAQLAAPMMVQCDRRALRQILINLANNAIKFTDEGIVRLEVGRADKGASTVFSVIDTGCGIRLEDQTCLFAAFEQVGGAAAGPFEGTGLGLYICQTLAAALDASISFRSEFGAGSTFSLEVADP